MKKNNFSKWLLASSLFITTGVLPVHSIMDFAIVAAQGQLPVRKVSLGATLNSAEIQQTLQLLNGQDIQSSDQIFIDGNRVNQYLSDGSNANTDVYSSAIIEPREAGYGVQVQILTPQNIQNVSVQTYQNAAITSGAKDVLIKIASVHPVTGEGALAGVYSIYQANGNQLNQRNITVAQQEITLPDAVKEKDKLTDAQINQLTANIKARISEYVKTNGSITDDVIKNLVQELADQLEKDSNVSVSEDSRLVIFNLMKDFAKLEVENYQDTLEDSNQYSWTKEQALDLYQSAANSNFKISDHPIFPLNDELTWEELERTENSTYLRYGDTYYQFDKGEEETWIYTGPFEGPQYDNFTEMMQIDHNTLYLLRLINRSLLPEGGLITSVGDAINYTDQAVYPITPIEGYKHIGTNQLEGYWDLATFYYDESGVEQDIAEFRVWDTGQIDFLTQLEAIGEPIDYNYDTNDPGPDAELGEPLWNEDKEQALEEFMIAWGLDMSQTYKKRTPAEPGSMYGITFPNDVFNYLAVVDEQVLGHWSTDGLSYTPGDYAVVAAYEDSEHYFEVNPEAPAGAHYYLFAIVDGEPVVLHSQQNEGNEEGLLYFNPSENTALQNGFKEIVSNY